MNLDIGNLEAVHCQNVGDVVSQLVPTPKEGVATLPPPLAFIPQCSDNFHPGKLAIIPG